MLSLDISENTSFFQLTGGNSGYQALRVNAISKEYT